MFTMSNSFKSGNMKICTDFSGYRILNKFKIFFDSSFCLTLNIKITISWRLFILALSRRSSQDNFQLRQTALRPLSFTRSSFFLSIVLQKCHVRLQQVRQGRIGALQIQSLASVGISFLSLITTPINLLVFLHVADM